MADKREIDGWRQGYRNYSEADLIRVMREKVPYCAEHIAAEQELVDRRQTDATRKSEADKDHRLAQLAQAERQHSERQWWTRFSAWVGALGVFVAVASFLSGRFWPTPQVSSLERRVAALEQKQTASAPSNLTPTTTPQSHSPPQTATTPPATATPSPAAQTTPAPKTTP